MAEVREERQRERAKSREGRRGDANEPNEERDRSSLDLKRAAATAVTAALAGALVGAAKSVVDRRGRSSEGETTDAGDDDRASAPAPEDEAELSHERQEDDEPDEQEPGEPHEAQRDDEPQRVRAQDADESPHTEESAQTGAPSGDVAKIIARAKEHVEAVIGTEAESVSGVQRVNGNWRVDVAVVQMRRVPESTDILASYAVVLDGDGDLISVQETRRYRRSQADDDR